MSIFVKEKHIDPRYAHLKKFGDIMWAGAWTPAKYLKSILKMDVPYILNRMDSVSSTVLKRTILASALVEDKVKTFWSFLVIDIPQTVVGEVGSIFGNSEVVHAQSYRFLMEALNLTNLFESIDSIPCMKGRIEYLSKHLSKTNTPKDRQVLKKLMLFTALVERVSLFSQFYIVMSFNNAKKGLKTLYSLQSVTATEELYHYKFGLTLINIIKSENAELFDQDLKEFIEYNIEKAHRAELSLIDWIFEEGCPTHLSKFEVINFLNKNINQVCEDMGVDKRFEVDEDYYDSHNSWMMQALKPLEPDFFDNPIGGYSSIEEEISEEEIEEIFG